jgi:hypothetical protein
MRAHSTHPGRGGGLHPGRRRVGSARLGRILRPAAALDKIAVIMEPRVAGKGQGTYSPLFLSPAARPLSAGTPQRRCGVFAGREQPICEQLLDRCAIACQPVRDTLSTSCANGRGG